MAYEQFEATILTYRYDELVAYRQEWWDRTSEDIRHQMLVHNDITFEDWILSQTKEGDIIEVNDDEKTFNVVGNYA